MTFKTKYCQINNTNYSQVHYAGVNGGHKMLPWSQRVNKWDKTCLSFFFFFSRALFKEINVHRIKGTDSRQARQCILSTVLPLYCSSIHGLAYDIMLTKAEGDSGWACLCGNCHMSWQIWPFTFLWVHEILYELLNV